MMNVTIQESEVRSVAAIDVRDKAGVSGAGRIIALLLKMQEHEVFILVRSANEYLIDSWETLAKAAISSGAERGELDVSESGLTLEVSLPNEPVPLMAVLRMGAEPPSAEEEPSAEPAMAERKVEAPEAALPQAAAAEVVAAAAPDEGGAEAEVST